MGDDVQEDALNWKTDMGGKSGSGVSSALPSRVNPRRPNRGMNPSRLLSNTHY